MFLRKLILQVLRNQKKIMETLDPKVIGKSEAYEELKKSLNKINLRVKHCYVIINNKGEYEVHCEYEINPQIITINAEDGELEVPEEFRALNLSGLVSLSDMQKISNKIKEAKEMNKSIIAK